MNNLKNKGNIGENIACEYMVKNGYKHIESNYHSRYGEIDIIAEDDKYIVFVEVKTRKSNTVYSGLEAVDSRKATKIMRTAFEYLAKNMTTKQPRFDIITVELIGGKIKHYINAFSEDDCNALF